MLFWQRVPFQLSNGLYLERSKTLLGWNKSRRYGRTVDVVTSSSGPTLRFDWRDESIFDGISVGVTYRTELKNIFYLFPKPPSGAAWASAEHAYEVLSPELKSRFGNPHKQGEDNGLPYRTWRFGRIAVHLGVFDRFGPQLGFHVSQKDRS